MRRLLRDAGEGELAPDRAVEKRRAARAERNRRERDAGGGIKAPINPEVR
jgi:hypothetical protein